MDVPSASASEERLIVLVMSLSHEVLSDIERSRGIPSPRKQRKKWEDEDVDTRDNIDTD